MARFLPQIASVFLVTFLAPSVSEGAYTVSLSPASDAASLKVGDTFTLFVTLAGLDPAAGDALDSLGATVEVTPASGIPALGTPVIAAGEIVPDLTGFLPAPNPGVGSSTYDVLFSSTEAPITGDGVFFSLTFTAQQAGAGKLTFTSLSAFVGFNEVAVGNGTPVGIDFVVSDPNPPVSPAPAPSAWVLALTAAPCLALRAWLAGSRARFAGCRATPPAADPFCRRG
jgi:hypothetical protein